MCPERKVYLLDPQQLDPETIAVTFAKTSRSSQSFAEIAAELTSEKSAEFHEKWVVGYGHASVAEHAVLHIAVENISRLAVECLESNRLASYTEKSTRYQKWSPEDFYQPDELTDAPQLRAVYTAACRQLFDTYLEALPAVREVVQTEQPRQAGESEAAWERRIRSEYVDVCRFLLPAASLANVGVTINARALEHALRKMFSHPLAEVRAVAEEIRLAAQVHVPTLVKYVDAVPYLQQTARDLTQAAAGLPTLPQPQEDWFSVAFADEAGETRVLAAALYRFGGLSFAGALQRVQAMDGEARARLAEYLVGGLGRFDIPLRELEYAQYIFDVVMDQGAYFEVKRHRMMSQTPQALTTRLGYCVPVRMVSAGMEARYRAALEQARDAYEALAEQMPQAASYVVPNGFNRRVLLGCNLRSAAHFVALRSAPNAHFSVRRVAQRMGAEIGQRSPLLAAVLRAAPDETWQGIETQYFTQTA